MKRLWNYDPLESASETAEAATLRVENHRRFPFHGEISRPHIWTRTCASRTIRQKSNENCGARFRRCCKCTWRIYDGKKLTKFRVNRFEALYFYSYNDKMISLKIPSNQPASSTLFGAKSESIEWANGRWAIAAKIVSMFSRCGKTSSLRRFIFIPLAIPALMI